MREIGIRRERRCARGSPETRTVPAPAPSVKWLGSVDYEPTWREMQRITDTRDENTPDEIWLLEHPPVFTLGLNADAGHVLAAGDIPVVKIDRGGQVTYHGPGQLVVYPLIDIRRAGLGVRDLVTALERAVIDYCASLGITAECRKNAPGVYVDGRKIAQRRPAHPPRRQLPRPRVQREHGTRAVPAHQSLRLRRTADDAARRAGPAGRHASRTTGRAFAPFLHARHRSCCASNSRAPIA